MASNPPDWALRMAGPQDRELVLQAEQTGTMQIKWPEGKIMRKWAKQQGWQAPWFGFEGGFIKKMLESDENFALALNGSEIELIIPIERYTVTAERLQELDELYDARGENGRPTDWGILVAELRGIRRAVEAGVVVEVDGNKLKSFGGFYSWAHGRYHMLEDGYDDWIGID